MFQGGGPPTLHGWYILAEEKEIDQVCNRYHLGWGWKKSHLENGAGKATEPPATLDFLLQMQSGEALNSRNKKSQACHSPLHLTTMAGHQNMNGGPDTYSFRLSYRVQHQQSNILLSLEEHGVTCIASHIPSLIVKKGLEKIGQGR